MTDMNKVNSLLSDFNTNTTEIMGTIRATKGPVYAAHLAAVAQVINIIRATNSMICEKYPTEIVDLIQTVQSKYTMALIEPFFAQQFPEDDPVSLKRRWAACDEFEKNVQILVERQMAVERAVGKSLLPRAGDHDLGE